MCLLISPGHNCCTCSSMQDCPPTQGRNCFHRVLTAKCIHQVWWGRNKHWRGSTDGWECLPRVVGEGLLWRHFNVDQGCPLEVENWVATLKDHQLVSLMQTISPDSIDGVYQEWCPPTLDQLGRKKKKKSSAHQHLCTWRKIQQIPVSLAHSPKSMNLLHIWPTHFSNCCLCTGTPRKRVLAPTL